MLDGEIVVLDAGGAPDFGALQAGRGPFTYVAFDLLHVDGEWIEDEPWQRRRARLADVVAPESRPLLMLSDHVDATGTDLFALARARDLEGIIAKRRDAPYRPGRRTGDWLKIKTHREATVVIGGFTEGAGSRRGTVGALLVGRAGGAGADVPVTCGIRALGRPGAGALGSAARRARCPIRPS